MSRLGGHIRRAGGAHAQPEAMPLGDGPSEHALVLHATPLPYWARNRSQRVPGATCGACGGPVQRARRGPTPRHCVTCEIGLRRRRQLRAYLSSAARLAEEVARPEVATGIRTVLGTLGADGEQA